MNGAIVNVKSLAQKTQDIIEGLESSNFVFGEEQAMRNERAFQAQLIQKLYAMFPGCCVMKNDSGYTQGIPDLTILYGSHWAVLEVKASSHAPHQPNQAYYIGELGAMSFASFIYPENEEKVLRGLQKAFGDYRHPRFLKRK